MTSSGKNGLNIRTNASPKWGQDQVSGGVSVLCWLAAPVAMFYENIVDAKCGFIDELDLIIEIGFLPNAGVSIEHLQRMQHTNRWRLLKRQ